MYSVEPDAENRAVIAWHGITSVTADDLAAARGEDAAGVGSVRDEIADHLGEWLKARPLSRKEVMGLAKSAGFSERSVDRVRAKIGIKTTRNGFGTELVSYWSLPESPPISAIPAIPATRATHENVAGMAELAEMGAGSGMAAGSLFDDTADDV